MKISKLIPFLQYVWAMFVGFITAMMHLSLLQSLPIYIVSAVIMAFITQYLSSKFKDR